MDVDLVIGIKPTGWTFGGKKGTGVRKNRESTIIVKSLSYSEHSSFSELKAFVKKAKPKEILPTVNFAKKDDIIVYIMPTTHYRKSCIKKKSSI